MSVYTPEPWIAFGINVWKENGDEDPVLVVTAFNAFVPESEDNEVEKCANIQRIVDCVNACEGIPQSYLRKLAEENMVLLDRRVDANECLSDGIAEHLRDIAKHLKKEGK